MKYSDLLKDLRLDNDESQKDIAKVLNISRSTYNDYETQYSVLPVKHLNSLCNHFNISIDYLLGLTDKKEYLNSIKDIDKIKAGNRLKEFRKENKLNQKELASLLNTTFSTIAWYEKGRNLISTSFLYTICKKYNISADYLLGRIDEPKYLK